MRGEGGQGPEQRPGREPGRGEFRGGGRFGGVRRGAVLARRAAGSRAAGRVRPDRRGRGCRPRGRKGRRRTLPHAETPHGVGHRPVGAGGRRGNVRDGDALCQRVHVAVVDAGGLRTGARFLHQRMAAAPPRLGQYGHAGGRKHRSGLPVQRGEHALSRILGGPGHPSPRLFRGGERHHRLYPAGAPARSPRPRPHLGGHPQADGAPARDRGPYRRGRAATRNRGRRGTARRPAAGTSRRTDRRGRNRRRRQFLCR